MPFAERLGKDHAQAVRLSEPRNACDDCIAKFSPGVSENQVRPKTYTKHHSTSLPAVIFDLFGPVLVASLQMNCITESNVVAPVNRVFHAPGKNLQHILIFIRSNRSYFLGIQYNEQDTTDWRINNNTCLNSVRVCAWPVLKTLRTSLIKALVLLNVSVPGFNVLIPLSASRLNVFIAGIFCGVAG